VQPVVEFVGRQEAAFVEQFADGGKVGGGGTIKAITDRASPGVFRVVALPAPAFTSSGTVGDVLGTTVATILSRSYDHPWSHGRGPRRRSSGKDRGFFDRRVP
jgi:hypothetical protein